MLGLGDSRLTCLVDLHSGCVSRRALNTWITLSRMGLGGFSGLSDMVSASSLIHHRVSEVWDLWHAEVLLRD